MKRILGILGTLGVIVIALGAALYAGLVLRNLMLVALATYGAPMDTASLIGWGTLVLTFVLIGWMNASYLLSHLRHIRGEK